MCGDMSKMWKTLKELLPNKKGNSANLPSVSKTDFYLADDFNNHFINIGKSSPRDVSHPSDKCNNHTEINCKFEFSEISVDQVIDEINNIPQNKASGLDGISTKLLKYAVNVIAPILCKLFNISFTRLCPRWTQNCQSYADF